MDWLFLQSSFSSFIQEWSDRLPFINEVLSNTLRFLGQLTGALLILLFGRWISKSLAKAISKLFSKMGVDRLMERLGAIDLFRRSTFKIVPSVIISRVVYYLFFFLFFWIAVDILGIAALSEMIAKLFDYLPVLFSALVVFIAGLFLADFLKKIVQTACKSLNIPAGNLISNFVFYFLFVNVVMITLSQAGIQTDSIEENISIILAGIVAAFAIGYGYASRPLLANLLASYYYRNRIRVGDKIGIEEVAGEVVAIDNTTFTLEDGGKTYVIPLSKLTTEKYQIKKG